MKTAATSLLLLSTLAAAAPAAAQTPAAAPAPATARRSAPAHTGSVTGTVADSLGRQALPFATVLLQAAPAAGAPAAPTGAAALLSTITDAQGAFRFEAVPAGRYELRVRYLGYRPAAPRAVEVAAGGAVALPALLLAPDAQQLKGVTVTATRPFIEQRADKLVLHVAASPLAAGGTAYDLLGRAPGVIETGTGFQLRGKAVTVLLDGKPTNLSGEELKNLLGTLPGSSLAQVEVIANPAARYDASGAAVVNFITAKSQQFGTSGTATAGTGRGEYGRATAGLSLTHRTAKLTASGGLDYLGSTTYSSTRAARELEGGGAISEAGRDVLRSTGGTARLGLDYQLSPTTSLGFLLKGGLTRRTRDGENLALLQPAGGSAQDQRGAVFANAGRSQVLNPALNLYYKTRLDTLGRTLSLSADYFGYAKNSATDYTLEQLEGTAPTQYLRDSSPARNAVRSLAADFSQPIYHGTLEAGLKATFTTTDNDIRWQQAQAGQPWQPDAGKTNHFVYEENINAAYLSASRQLGKVGVQLGLRAEQTNTTGTSRTTGQRTERHYFDLFPSVGADVKLSEQAQLSLSYRRKIDRFRFGIVNPFVSYVSQYRYQQGNPAIQPTYSHNFELTHSLGDLLSTSVSYGHHTNVLVESYQQNEATQVVVTSFRNYGSAESISASTTLMKPLLGGKWHTQTTLGLEYARVNSAAVGLRATRPSAYLSSNHTLRLPRGFKAEAAAMYMSPMTFGGVAFRPQVSSSFAVAKSLFGEAGTLTLSVTDPFNLQQTGYRVLAAGLNSANVDKIESRFVKLNFSYKFGNQRVKAGPRRRTGIEAEQRRMEN